MDCMFVVSDSRKTASVADSSSSRAFPFDESLSEMITLPPDSNIALDKEDPIRPAPPVIKTTLFFIINPSSQ